MNQHAKIAAVGDASSILLFHAVGVHTIAAESAPEVERAVVRLAREGYAVIYLTEQAAALIPETLAHYKTEAYPALIPIPNRSGSNGYGMRGIRENIEKAVGTALF